MQADPGYAVIMRGGQPIVYAGLHSISYWAKTWPGLMAGGSVDPHGNSLSVGDGHRWAADHAPGCVVLTEKEYAILIDNPQIAAWKHRDEVLHPEKALRRQQQKEARREKRAEQEARRVINKVHREIQDAEIEIRKLARQRMLAQPYVFPSDADKAEDEARRLDLAALRAKLVELQAAAEAAAG